MRTLLIACFIFSMLVSCTGTRSEEIKESAGLTQSVRQEGTAIIEFRESRYDFGNVSHGEKLAYTFIYKNTGDAPLVIHSARADCGCTIPEYDSEPLAPGKEGRLKVVFNTQGFMGYQAKTLQLLTNAKDPVVTLAIRAIIE